MGKSYRSIIVGKGEVGTGLYKVLHPYYGTNLYIKDIEPLSLEDIDILNICIPYSNDFIRIVNAYVEYYQPQLTIVHSTVPIGTTRQVNGLAVHSPIRGRHPNMERDIKTYTKFIGFNDLEACEIAYDYLEPVFNCKTVSKTESTELAKLLCLAEYGIDIAFADYSRKLCDKYKVDYDIIRKYWNETYNDGIVKVGYPYLQRPVLSPPNGKIGGHCVTQNTYWLNKSDTNPMLLEVLNVGKQSEISNIGEGTRVWQYCNIYPTAKIGKNCIVGAYSEIGDGVKIGDNCKLGAYVFLPKGVRIGNNVFIGPKVTATNDKYPRAIGEWVVKETVIEDDVSIGANVTIVCGITLHKGCKIGSGSVVTKSVPAGEVWVGNPAKEIKSIW